MQTTLALAAVGEMNDTRREWLAQFFEAQHARLFRFALRVAGDREEALDFVQEAFLRAARDLRRFPGGDDQAVAWMFRTIVNLARDRYRRQRVRDLFRSMLGRRNQLPDPNEQLTTASAVRTAIAHLPPRQRALIALCELEGVSNAAAAAALGISESTVRWHLAEARKRLAVILGARQ